MITRSLLPFAVNASLNLITVEERLTVYLFVTPVYNKNKTYMEVDVNHVISEFTEKKDRTLSLCL